MCQSLCVASFAVLCDFVQALQIVIPRRILAAVLDVVAQAKAEVVAVREEFEEVRPFGKNSKKYHT